MKAVTVSLDKPILDFGQPITALVISREVEIDDLIEVEDVEKKTLRSLMLMQRLYRTPEGKELLLDSLRHLRPSDFSKLDQAMGPFLVLGPGTGAPSPEPSPSASSSPSTSSDD